MPELPEKVVALSRAIRDAGGRALLVGGCVRDKLMSIPSKDWDLEVYNLGAERLREILDQFGSVNVARQSPGSGRDLSQNDRRAHRARNRQPARRR